MRIAVAGKGGSGKTTISGTLARTFAADGHRVLAVDADPNPNLGLTLGLPTTAYDDGGPLPHDVLEHREVEGQKVAVLARPVDDIVDRYGQAGPDGIDLLTMARPREAGGG